LATTTLPDWTTLRYRAEIGAQELAKLLQGEAHPGLDCPERFIEHCGDFGLG